MDSTAFHRNPNFYDNYLSSEGVTVDEQFNSFIGNSITGSIQFEVFNEFIKQALYIPHHCYECRQPLDIDVSYLIKYNREINEKQYLCELHKNDSKISRYSVAFFRYETVFMRKLRQFLTLKIN